MVRSDDVLSFWLDEVGEDGWYKGGADLDDEIRTRFQSTWESLADGSLSMWLTYPSGTLAYIILADQFPRNMFRDSDKAFETDAIAVAAAKQAIARGWDMKIDEPARQFFYVPLMHSECLADQDRCVRLMKTRMPECGEENLLHAKAHREIIRKFGRFPFRNKALSRTSQKGEEAFMEEGGYGATVRALQEPVA